MSIPSGMHLSPQGPLPEDPEGRRTSLGRGRGSRQHQGVHDPGNVASTSSCGLNEQQSTNQNNRTNVQNPTNGHQNPQTAHQEQAKGNDRHGDEQFESFEVNERNDASHDQLTPRMRHWID